MVTDPVCRMNVDESKTDFHLRYEQREYYFCSQGCMAEFERHTEDYVSFITQCCGEEKLCADSSAIQGKN